MYHPRFRSGDFLPPLEDSVSTLNYLEFICTDLSLLLPFIFYSTICLYECGLMDVMLLKLMNHSQ